MTTAAKYEKSTGAASAFVVAFLAATIVCRATAAEDADTALIEQARQLFKPVPKDMATSETPVTPERVALGRMLFFDPRVSLDGTVSCARCHQPALYGTDGLPVSIGTQGRLNARNAPTVLNAALQFVEHWHGDRASVEDQASKSLLGPASFGNPDHATAMVKVEALGYGPMFEAAFPGEQKPVTGANWGKSIGAYERTLVTPSAFDAYLEGNAQALPPLARAGLSKFIGYGCAGCHNGVGVGGGMYRKFGLVKEYWSATGSKQIDKGRFEFTNDPADLYVFKVPGLRNVAMTPPYFHDGSVHALADAVRVMADVQLGKSLDAEDVAQLIAFLESLTGRLPEQFVTAPELPPSAFPVAGP